MSATPADLASYEDRVAGQQSYNAEFSGYWTRVSGFGVS